MIYEQRAKNVIGKRLERQTRRRREGAKKEEVAEQDLVNFPICILYDQTNFSWACMSGVPKATHTRFDNSLGGLTRLSK